MVAAGGERAGEQPLTPLLQKALPRGPAAIRGQDPAAVLALALHVQMVEAGLQTLLANGITQPRGRYPPAASWHGAFPDEWVFEYAAQGKAHKLVLHCSLQRATGRLFVNATEVHNSANSQVLGLQLNNYVPDSAPIGGSSWEGVIARQPALRSMFRQHVVVPLLEGAQDLPSAASMDEAGGPLADGGSKASGAAWPAWMPVDRRTTFSVVLPTVAVTAVTVASIAVVVARRSRQRHAALSLGGRT